MIAPMAPAAFINPAVIHRTAPLCRASAAARGALPLPRGVAMGGGPATLPLRFAAAGMLPARRRLCGARARAARGAAAVGR